MLIYLRSFKNHLLLHLIVLIYGFTGIFGKLISIKAIDLVWYRLLIAVSALLGFILLKGVGLKTDFRTLVKYFGVGFIIALHWVCFYESIKLGAVSVAVICLSASTFFTALIEPFVFKRKISRYEIFGGIIIFFLLYWMFSGEKVSPSCVGFGVASAFLASVFPVLNGVLTGQDSPYRITFYELLGGLVFLTIMLSLTGDLTNSSFWNISQMDWLWLVVLGIICTSFAFVISVSIMREISPFTVVMSINLEPIYTILLAYFIFGVNERRSYQFYLGSVAIVACIFCNAYLKGRHKS